MDKSEKDRLSKYGKLVLDFANANISDDILTTFFPNLQSAFNFSKDFTEKALSKFPTKKMTIGRLSKDEHDLFELLRKRNRIIGCGHGSHNCYLEQYDPIALMFTIVERHYEQIGEDDFEPVEERFLISKDEYEKYTDEGNTINNERKNEIKADLRDLIQACNQIEELKPNATKRFEEIEKIAKTYERVEKIHDYVNNAQKILKSVLLQIIRSEPARKSDEFKKTVSNHYMVQLRKRKYKVTDDYQLIESDVFVEDEYLPDASLDGYQTIFDMPISYCLIELLKNPEYSVKERISICNECENIYIKSKLNNRQIYCPVCSRKNKMTPEERAEYMKSYRANPARKKTIEKKKRIERIQHLIINAGKTKNEAEIIVDDET